MDLNTLKEYLNIHRISLEQDKENVVNQEDSTYLYLAGQLVAINHILELINE